MAFGGKSIEYQTLGAREIRLVRLIPGPEDSVIEMQFLPHASIDSPPPYHALSYTWGDPKKTCDVVIDDITVPVTQNLAGFLQQHRQDLVDKIGTLWVDAICINQKDNDEKIVQIMLMRYVYERAQSTIVWLGLEQEECVKGLELMKKIPRAIRTAANPLGYIDPSPWLEHEANRELVKDCWFSFINFTSLPWFSRVWVKQEYIVSSIIELQYGKHFFSLYDLLPATWIRKSDKFTGMEGEIFAKHPQERWRVRQSYQSMFKIGALTIGRVFRNKSIDPLRHVLWTFRGNQATDPRDNIYALFGLLGPATSNQNAKKIMPDMELLGYDPDVLIVDYNAKVEDIFKSVVKAVVMAEKRLDIICAAQSGPIPGYPLMSNLPSWVPDWTRPWVGNSLLFYRIQNQVEDGSGRYFAASKSSDAIAQFSNDANTLRVKGVEVDIIDEVWSPLVTKIDNEDRLTRGALAEYTRAARRWRARRSSGIYGTREAADTAHWSSLTAELGKEGIPNRGKNLSSWRVEFDDWILNSTYYTTMIGAFTVTMAGRTTMIGTKGYVIAGSIHVLPGDLVCVLLGCQVPVVLRGHGDAHGRHFEFVGECYCHGIMNGEMMDAVDDGTADVVEFELR